MQASAILLFCHEASLRATSSSMDAECVEWLRAAEDYILNSGNKNEKKKGGICFSESLQKTKLHPLYSKTTNK